MQGPAVGISTGNWGCGVFRGDAKLKFLVQLMAATEGERDGVAYFTFGDRKLSEELRSMHKLLVENRVTVGEATDHFLFAFIFCVRVPSTRFGLPRNQRGTVAIFR